MGELNNIEEPSVLFFKIDCMRSLKNGFPSAQKSFSIRIR
jgi:hypothetical protein